MASKIERKRVENISYLGEMIRVFPKHCFPETNTSLDGMPWTASINERKRVEIISYLPEMIRVFPKHCFPEICKPLVTVDFPYFCSKSILMKNFLYSLVLPALVLASSHSLYAHVELDNPKGGETFVSGTTVTVQWHITIAHVTLNWDLLYSLDGGSTWEYIEEDIPPGQLSFQWHVPGEATSQARISIIQDNEGQDYQDESTNFTIQSTTSIPTIPGSYLHLYPNPVNDLLTVDLSNNTHWPANLKLLNATGNAVLEIANLDKIALIQISTFLPGLYLLQIETPQGISTRKLIVQKS